MLRADAHPAKLRAPHQDERQVADPHGRGRHLARGAVQQEPQVLQESHRDQGVPPEAADDAREAGPLLQGAPHPHGGLRELTGTGSNFTSVINCSLACVRGPGPAGRLEFSETFTLVQRFPGGGRGFGSRLLPNVRRKPRLSIGCFRRKGPPPLPPLPDEPFPLVGSLPKKQTGTDKPELRLASSEIWRKIKNSALSGSNLTQFQIIPLITGCASLGALRFSSLQSSYPKRPCLCCLRSLTLSCFLFLRRKSPYLFFFRCSIFPLILYSIFIPFGASCSVPVLFHESSRPDT